MAELNIFHYIPKKSVIHDMDGRIKLICMVLFTITAGISVRALDLIILTSVLILAFAGSRLPVKNLLTEIRYFLFLIGLVMVVHLLNVPGTPIPNLPFPGPTWEGLYSGLLFGWRLILIILLSIILTGTTPLSLLKNVIEWFLRPVPLIREARVATMFSLIFVLIPLIFDQAAEMAEAQKTRCIDGRKNLVSRIKFLIFPLMLHTFMRADEIALAMESRCYSDTRTKAVFKTTINDWSMLIFSGLTCCVVIFRFF
jgi:biotin transport system permease protein